MDSSLFYKDKQKSDRLSSWCKACQLLACCRYRSENIVKVRERDKKRGRKKNYGITFKEFSAMLELQDFKCQICGVEIRLNREQHLDHNHKTGQIRSILCRSCNHGIGNFKDDPELMLLAIAYLRGFNEDF